MLRRIEFVLLASLLEIIKYKNKNPQALESWDDGLAVFCSAGNIDDSFRINITIEILMPNSSYSTKTVLWLMVFCFQIGYLHKYQERIQYKKWIIFYGLIFWVNVRHFSLGKCLYVSIVFAFTIYPLKVIHILLKYETQMRRGLCFRDFSLLFLPFQRKLNFSTFLSAALASATTLWGIDLQWLFIWNIKAILLFRVLYWAEVARGMFECLCKSKAQIYCGFNRLLE